MSPASLKASTIDDPTANEQEPSLDTFKDQIKAGVTDPHPYNRLMITYRKEKRYDDELRVIKRAIQVFEKQLKTFHESVLKGNRKRSDIAALSDKINRQTGLSDKKGNAAYVPEPIAGWLKRRATVEKKLHASPAKKKKSHAKKKKVSPAKRRAD